MAATRPEPQKIDPTCPRSKNFDPDPSSFKLIFHSKFSHFQAGSFLVMSLGQKFLTLVRSGQFIVARVGSGQPFIVWVWIWKISPKNVKFFPSGRKKSLRVGSKSTRVKGGSASYLLRVKSKLESGQGPSLVLSHFFPIFVGISWSIFNSKKLHFLIHLCFSLLTLSTQHANSQKSLPPVSYIKAIDVFMSGCTVFVFLSLMEYALVNIVMGDIADIEKKKSSSISKLILGTKGANFKQIDGVVNHEVRGNFFKINCQTSTYKRKITFFITL